MDWKSDEADVPIVYPEPRKPLTVGEHCLFAFLLVAIIGLCTLLTLMSGGAA